MRKKQNPRFQPAPFFIPTLGLIFLGGCATPFVFEGYEDEPLTNRYGIHEPFNPSLPGRRPWLSEEMRDEYGSVPHSAVPPSGRGTAPFARNPDAHFEEEYPEETPQKLRLGMSRQEVRRVLGSPADVEIAGDIRDGNLRWIYPTSTFRSLGPTKVVTFEEGQVAGWETVRPD
jgi:hypothetical protein